MITQGCGIFDGFFATGGHSKYWLPGWVPNNVTQPQIRHKDAWNTVIVLVVFRLEHDV